MKYVDCRERPDWKETATSLGYQSLSDYWDETHYYAFTAEQVDRQIAPAVQSLHDICLEFVDRAVSDEYILGKLGIPGWFWGRLKESWQKRSPSLLGRFDLVYDGILPPKMMEYNADTPGMVYDTGFFQLQWLEQAAEAGIVPAGSDQFNSLQDSILKFFSAFHNGGKPLDFSCLEGAGEDQNNLQYLMNCARHMGHETRLTFLEDIRHDGQRAFTDADGRKIDVLFKYYPWEWMLAEDPGKNIPHSDITFLEPEWKMILSGKGCLPFLWQYFKGHPNLLPAYFADEADKPDLSSSYVKKPVFSRRGSDIAIFENGVEIETSEDAFGVDAQSGYIVQEYCALPQFKGRYTSMGAWVSGNAPAGIIMLESPVRITASETDYLIPHIVI